MLSKCSHFKKLAPLSKFLSSSCQKDESGYQQVPHYKQKSALYIRPPLSSSTSDEASIKTNVFPKIISPDLDLSILFDAENSLKTAIKSNLTARHTHLNTAKLKDDYTRMKVLEVQIETLTIEKNLISTKINNLVKSLSVTKQSKKSIMETDEAKQFLHLGNEIKHKINALLDELIPLEEIVRVACLRLPNDLHFSTYYVHNCLLNKETEDELVLFNFNQNYLSKIRLNSEFWSISRNWQNAIDIPKPSFIQYASVNAAINLRYSVGTYAKIEQALQDYIFEKLSRLNVYEHIKSVSMFKSALIEGCGQNFNDSRQIFNIVRFSGGETSDPLHIELLHLTGNSSLNSLILNFVRTQTKEKYLPWTVFTNGKYYSPKHGQTSSFGLLTLCSDKSLHIIDDKKYDENNMDEFLSKGEEYLNEIKRELTDFALTNPQSNLETFNQNNKEIDKILIDLLKLMIYMFKEFNLPMRFSCLSPSKLNYCESLRIELQCYLPSEQNYVTVSSII